MVTLYDGWSHSIHLLVGSKGEFTINVGTKKPAYFWMQVFKANHCPGKWHREPIWYMVLPQKVFDIPQKARGNAKLLDLVGYPVSYAWTNLRKFAFPLVDQPTSKNMGSQRSVSTLMSGWFSQFGCVLAWVSSLGIKTAFCEQAGMYSLYSYGINSPVFWLTNYSFIFIIVYCYHHPCCQNCYLSPLPSY